MKALTQIKTIPYDSAKIDKEAVMPFFYSTVCQTPTFIDESILQFSGVDMNFEMPFVYLDSESVYSIFANWSPFLNHHYARNGEITVCVHPQKPANLKRIAWTYFWHMFVRDFQPDCAIERICKLLRDCPDEYRTHLLSVENNSETKAILKRAFSDKEQGLKQEEPIRGNRLDDYWGKP